MRIEPLNMDISSNQRKLSSREDRRFFSQTSILSSMDRFVSAVDNMNATVMVPSRLMDMDMNTESTSSSSATGLTKVSSMTSIGRNTDLYSFYSMLNSVKTELLWGASANAKDKDRNNELDHHSSSSSSSISRPSLATSSSNSASSASVRRLSSVSSFSLGSDSEEGEIESCSESDSGVEYEVEDSNKIAAHFRKHLSGLGKMLEQLTDSANLLANRYQTEVGGAS